ncbi:hypothetical protein BGZ97_011275 [Linnemannia gamsii]|uniref:Uncharacterized protein n=1 Tax=Linnemannia gamsii TaxID=64522 RepID=A0A9P6R6K3_9FUNG|nr:hypothetical protein BGZ97_011275 [Linnemannia gamsii]
METDEYVQHQQSIEEDLEHLNGSTRPVFQSIAYDPTALMELQSIPSMIPERSSPGAPYPPNGVSIDAIPSSQNVGDSTTPTSRTGEGAAVLHGLTPIPILLPPANGEHRASSITSVATGGSDGSRPKESGSLSVSSVASALLPESASSGSSIPTTLAVPGTQPAGITPGKADHDRPISLIPCSPQTEHRFISETPLEYRNAIIKELKMDPKSYNESVVMEMVWKVEGSDWTRDQKRVTVAHCLTIARGFRRHPVVLVLESLRQKLTKP